jgi:quercetin dioxygenase-like cupin family protein
MPVIRSTASTDHRLHGSVFQSYVAPSMGSVELCAWRLNIPSHQKGVAHRPTREEVVLVLGGEVTITIDGLVEVVHAGDVILVPANAEVKIDAGPSDVHAWVTTTPGIEAIMADGVRISPPWAK